MTQLFVEGEIPYKAYQVRWVGDPTKVIASFDTLDEAVTHIRTLRLDHKHEVTRNRKTVWPTKE